jgi:hypothetical protein
VKNVFAKTVSNNIISMTTNIKTGVNVDGKLKQIFQKMSSSGGDRFIKATVNSGRQIQQA